MKGFGLRIKEVLPKVVGIPTREPVNKQAALIIRPAPDWAKPLPPESPKQGELQELREQNSKMKATNLAQAQCLASLKRKCDSLQRTLEDQKAELSAVISRLEDKNKTAPEDEKELNQRVIRRAKIIATL